MQNPDGTWNIIGNASQQQRSEANNPNQSRRRPDANVNASASRYSEFDREEDMMEGGDEMIASFLGW